MSHQPKIAFCTTCKGRVQHLQKTLPQNLKDNEGYPDLVFVVLDYGDPWLKDFLQAHHEKDLASCRLVVYSFKTDGPFRMAHAKNLAHRAGILEAADVLVNLDADNFTGPGFAQYLAGQLQRPNVFCSPGAIKGKGKKLRGCGGRIAVTKPAFLNAGGYDEKYGTWASDDKDFVGRLKRLGYEGVEIDLQYLQSIPHGDGLRFKEYPHIRETAGSDELEIDASTATVANYGELGCGLVIRNWQEEINLQPVPTRIFGVGLHKTATNSLNAALNLLGYDSVHWRSPKLAKAIWWEMKSQGRSLEVERHYATSDLPIALLYKELDHAYPGSKFILTLRDEEKWLASVQNHWSYERNPWRKSWDGDCFTHRVHGMFYGATEPTTEAFLATYRGHSRDVLAYFKGRKDLLVMDMDQGAGWRELCGFLGNKVPNVPYPKEFKTK